MSDEIKFGSLPLHCPYPEVSEVINALELQGADSAASYIRFRLMSEGPIAARITAMQYVHTHDIILPYRDAI